MVVMLWQILGYATVVVNVLTGVGVVVWLRSVWVEPLRRPIRVPKRLDNQPITLDSDWIGFL